MRNLSMLGLKMLGIILVYRAMSDLCRALADIPLLFIQWSPADKPALMRALRREGLASNIVECIASGAFAAFVLARTEWITSKFNSIAEGAASISHKRNRSCWGYIKSRQGACVQKWTFGAHVFVSRSVAEADENMRWRAGVG